MASIKGSTCVIALQKILCRVDIMFTEKHQGVKKIMWEVCNRSGVKKTHSRSIPTLSL